MQKKLTELLAAFPYCEKNGSGDPVIERIAFDSRDVSPGTLFFALPTILKHVSLKDKYTILSIICAWGIYLSLGILDDASYYIPYKSILF